MAGPTGLIGEDMALLLTIGGADDGTIPTFAAGTNILGRARRVRPRGRVSTTNVKGMAPGPPRNRHHSPETGIEIEMFVPAAGYTAADSSGPMHGKVIWVQTKENSAMSAYRSWKGVITEWEGEAANEGSAQIERITVDCNPDWS